jgi:hypothetical protein
MAFGVEGYGAGVAGVGHHPSAAPRVRASATSPSATYTPQASSSSKNMGSVAMSLSVASRPVEALSGSTLGP